MSDIIREVEIDGVKLIAVPGGCTECIFGGPTRLYCEHLSSGAKHSCRSDALHGLNDRRSVAYMPRQTFALKRLKGEL